MSAPPNALGVTFQQIQKYERGTNAVASTRIADLCRALKITPSFVCGAVDFAFVYFRLRRQSSAQASQ